MNQQQQPPIPDGSSSESTHAPTKQGDWEQPDFEEFDLCMEVTAYMNHWQ